LGSEVGSEIARLVLQTLGTTNDICTDIGTGSSSGTGTKLLTITKIIVSNQ